MKAKWGRNDWEARLNGGVVLYEGIPHLISYDGERLSLLDLVSQNVVIRELDPLDEHLDVSSCPLGYINTREGAVYLQRCPLRRYKQAVDARAISESVLTSRGFSSNGEGRSNYLMSRNFRDTFSPDGYPSYETAIELLLESNVESVAVSRDIALTMDEISIIKVWYKMEQVGFITPGSRVVVVPSSDKAWVISMYLSELTWEIN